MSYALLFFFKQKTAYEISTRDWSSDVCSSDLCQVRDPLGNQRGGEMPKDRAEVQDQYKIGGGSLNEYEYGQSKGEYEEQTHQVPDDAPVEGLRGAAEPGLPENVAERIRQVEERAHEIVEKRRAKQRGGAGKAAPAAKKAAK